MRATTTIPWTGLTQSGNTVADGAYTCNVNGQLHPMGPHRFPTTVRGQVYSCNLTSNPPTYPAYGTQWNHCPGNERIWSDRQLVEQHDAAGVLSDGIRP